ncbi:hypothetical protein PR048_010869 [Dryococelus australis]|uniref:Glycoside hydrolase family 28 n=1 Tax=Dryococelus australis TaxID=614101 RepID=A0ABQ9I5V3_9NEOP|nr:hypothetical protein PR048_010869 [Dryococelus australis]
MKQSLNILLIFTAMAWIHVGTARDLRNVTEPKTPHTCTSLKATDGDDTEAIQKALDACAKGKIVALTSGTFYSGPLSIPSGVSLLVDDGVVLKAIPNPTLYDLGAKTCGTLDQYGVGCKSFITILGAKGSGIYGKGTIDGQANVTMTGKNLSWWQLSHEALKAHNYQNNPMLVQINNSVDITLYQVTLINSPFYTVTGYETDGLTVWGLTILAPASARNTDGVDPIGCQNVTIAHCFISIGDDHVAIKALTAPSRHISVFNNHFEHGNALAIGSEVNHGASEVTVANLTFNGSNTGIHIKSNTFRGGHVVNITYDNICAYRVRRPIHFEMTYGHLQGNRTPLFRNISINNMKVLTNGSYIIRGLSESNPIEVTLNNVHIAKNSSYSENFAKVTGKLVADATAIFTILALFWEVTARDLRNVTEPKIPQTCVSLVTTGKDDTKAIQNALDTCAKGKAVALSSGTFYSGPFSIPSGVGLLVDEGVTLKAIPNPALYDLGAKTCGTLNEFGVGCKAFITLLGVKGSGIYGKGTIDGQGNVTMTGKNETWWQLSNDAEAANNYQNNPMLVQINNSMDIALYQVTLINSPFYTVASYESVGLTVWGLTILAPASARNTDGIDPIGCRNVTIAHCYVSIGDDHVAIKALTAPSRHISVFNNHFDQGRGISIGSEVNHGARDVTVANVTFNGSVNAIHIKSNRFRGGHVTNIVYDNICIYKVQNPIVMEMTYDGLHGNQTPVFQNITISNMKVLTKGRYTIHGLKPKIPQTCMSLKSSGGDDTKIIQSSLDTCAKGKAVALSSGTFYSGPLSIPSGVGLLLDEGVTLKAIPNPALYDLGAKTCGTLNEFGVGCKAFITLLGVKGSGIYGKGTIDGQGNVTMTGKNETWWQLSNDAEAANNYQNNPMLVQINNSMDIALYQVTLINSPFYTVASYESVGLTVWGLTILAPASARNTDGIDPIGCRNVTIAHCYVSIGDDHVAIKALTAPSRHISVFNNHFDQGRGISIGSEVNHGARDVTVANVTFNGSVNAIHIKSNTFRGGHVVNISYDNICAYKVQHPIYLEMTYMHLHGNQPKTPQTCTSLKATGGDDSKAIQKALDSCTKGKAVVLSSGTFYSGPLNIPSGVSLLVDNGVTLKAIPNPELYDLGAKTCGTLNEYGVGCKAFITMHGAKGSGIYGKGTIDGQANITMTGKNLSWWGLSHAALAANIYQNNPMLVQINNSMDITLYQVTLINSPFYTVTAYETIGWTVWGLTILAPASARNTDGVDPIGCQNVTIAHCFISIGDDHVAIKALTAPSRHISVFNNHFEHGNALAIGSEVNHGASEVTVANLTLNGSRIGIHIKSNFFRGGHVVNISYDNVCIINVTHPVYLDMMMNNLEGPNVPVFHNITISNVMLKVMEEQLVGFIKSVIHNMRHRRIPFLPQLRNGSEIYVLSLPTVTNVVLQRDAALPN